MATATLSPQHSIHPSFPTPDAYNNTASTSTTVEAPVKSAAATTTSSNTNSKPPALHAAFKYYLPAADGSPPPPNYVNKPETFYRGVDSRVLPVNDIRGDEDNYSLDTSGFQVIKHVSAEKEFLDDEQIERVYYPEVESVLKEV